MALWARILFALAFSAKVEAVSSELNACIDGDVCEEIHEVSLLQTEVHLHQPLPPAAGQASEVPAKAAQLQAASKASKVAPSVPLTGTVIVAWIVIALAFFALAIVLYSCFMGKCDAASWPKYVAEFIGTFMLVFSVGCNVLVGDKTWGVTGIACTLMVSIYALGGVSGANFNPSVSVALGLTQKMPGIQVAIYVCVQLAAGIIAAIFYSALLGETFQLGPKADYTWAQAGVAELLYTFMLTFVVLNVAASNAHAGKNQFYGLAIGFSVVAGGYGAGSVSGGCFNPAIALGIDASTSESGFGWSVLYIAFELLGSLLAAVFFKLCRPEDYGGSAGLNNKLLSEFLGTFMLVLTVGLNVLAESKAGAFSIATSLMCMIFALGSCSGAHFNPAVTLAILAAGRAKISEIEAVLYMCAQIFGGVCASITYIWIMNGQTVPLQPGKEATIDQALAGEFVFTALLCFVVLSVATVENPLSEFFGLAIGACVIAGGYAIGSLSGGSLNPAVSAGLGFSDLAINGGFIEHVVSFQAVEFLAGLVAACLFRMTWVSEYPQKEELAPL